MASYIKTRSYALLSLAQYEAHLMAAGFVDIVTDDVTDKV